VLGGFPLYRVSKWRTFVGKKPLLILSFRAVLLCVSRKILVYTAAHTRLQGKGLQGFTFFLIRHLKFSFFPIEAQVHRGPEGGSEEKLFTGVENRCHPP
jgi:hypothetical protein